MPCTSCLGPCGPLTAARPAANWAEPRRAAMTSFRLLRRSAGSLCRRLAELHLWSSSVRSYSSFYPSTLRLLRPPDFALTSLKHLPIILDHHVGHKCRLGVRCQGHCDPLNFFWVLRITANMAQLKIKVKRSKVNFAATSFHSAPSSEQKGRLACRSSQRVNIWSVVDIDLQLIVIGPCDQALHQSLHIKWVWTDMLETWLVPGGLWGGNSSF